MADENDADSLRNQIAFLSNLIDSHKNDNTEVKTTGKAVLKNQVSLENSRKNKKWTRWKKEVAVKKTESTFTHGRQGTACGGKPERKAGLPSKTVLNCPTLDDLPSSKFSYRRKPLQTSVTLTIANPKIVSKSELVFVAKKKPNRVSPSSRVSITRTGNQSANNGVKNVLKHIPQNRYKLNRKNGTTCSTKTLPSTSKQSTTIENRREVNSPSTPHLTKLQRTATNASKHPNSNFKWSTNQRKLTRLQKGVTKRHGVLNKPINVAKGSKLKWRRKSASQSTLSKKTKTKPLQTQTIPRTSKLKWRRKSANHCNSLTGKKSKLAEKRQGRTQLVQKSRYSLKRIDTNQGRMLSTRPKTFTAHRPGGVQYSKGLFEIKNRSFVARRMKYIANGSHSYSTHANNSNRRTVNIHGMNYSVRLDGKTLQKMAGTKHKNTLSKVVHNPRQFKLVHGVKKSSKFTLNRVVNTTHTEQFRHRTLQRQNSINKYKNDKANKILRRTIQNVQASIKKDNKKHLKSEQYCMFYNKFGKCAKQKQGICPYIHDPTKIAVCTRFLRGTCQQMDGTCPFSHKADKEKMPICQYFLKGKCTRDDCPYSHVNVGRNADICQDFLKGYCAQGFKCKKKHVLECEEFNTTGQCPNGTKCMLTHRKKIQERKRYFQELTQEEDSPKVKRLRHRNSDSFLPLEDSTLNNSDKDEQTLEPICQEGSQIKSSVSLKIRPKFTRKTSEDG